MLGGAFLKHLLQVATWGLSSVVLSVTLVICLANFVAGRVLDLIHAQRNAVLKLEIVAK